MLIGLNQNFAEQYYQLPLRPNAAPEWQAGSLKWRSNEWMVACPLEGHVVWHYFRNSQKLIITTAMRNNELCLGIELIKSDYLWLNQGSTKQLKGSDLVLMITP
jgi:hypothetical protein